MRLRWVGWALALLAGAHSAAPPPRRQLQADTLDLCGDTCEAVATRGDNKLDERIRRRRNCRSRWDQGCGERNPPPGFTAASTLWDMCPIACPAV